MLGNLYLNKDTIATIKNVCHMLARSLSLLGRAALKLSMILSKDERKPRRKAMTILPVMHDMLIYQPVNLIYAEIPKFIYPKDEEIYLLLYLIFILKFFKD